MSEIIRFPVKNSESESDNISLDQEHTADMLNFLTALAKSDSRSTNSSNIEIRKQNLNKAETPWLVEMVNNSNRSNWGRNATYYHAIIAILRERGIL